MRGKCTPGNPVWGFREHFLFYTGGSQGGMEGWKMQVLLGQSKE